MHNGSLRAVLDKKGKNLPMNLRIQFSKDIAKGMLVIYYYLYNEIEIKWFFFYRSYLHSKKLIHRDLKSDNLLINNEWRCKVADFGISTIRPTITRAMTCIGTPSNFQKLLFSLNYFYLFFLISLYGSGSSC